MVAVNSRTIRRIEDYSGIAATLDDLFLPDECNDGEVVVRKGKIRSKSDGIVDVVFAHCKDLGVFSSYAITLRENGWQFELGGTLKDDVRMAIESVINQPCP